MNDDYGRQEEAKNTPNPLLGAKRAESIENNLYVKNIGNTRSLRTALNAMCAHCMGCNADHMEPNYKKDIKHCTSEGCPLWAFRPYKTGE